jgi:hypothetical protein
VKKESGTRFPHSQFNFFAAAVVLFAAVLLGIAVTGCGSSSAQSEGAQALKTQDQATTSPAEPSVETGKGMAAIKQAADAGKYLFVFFSEADDDQAAAMRAVFDKAMEKIADRAQSIVVNISDASEKAVVDKFDLSRAPMPLVLALAPNGAITGGFPEKFEEKELLDAFATPATEKVVKSLQDGKLVFVCVQGSATTSNDAALQGVHDFKADARFASATEIVVLDPSDEKESGFLTDLQVLPETKEAVTVLVVPPGQAVGMFTGATDKDTIIGLLSRATTACGPGGCGPGGCGPKR